MQDDELCCQPDGLKDRPKQAGFRYKRLRLSEGVFGGSNHWRVQTHLML